MSTKIAPKRVDDLSTELNIVDCDVHTYFENGYDDLAPYLSVEWRHRLGIGDHPDWADAVNGGQIGMPKNEFYRTSSSPLRLDAVPAAGGSPGSSPEHTALQLLDGQGIDRALLLGGPNSGNGAFPDGVVLAAFCAAYNDWVLERWCGSDRRYRAAILISPQAPDLAVKEIERLADRDGVMAVHMPVSNIPPGSRQLNPIYEAAQHYRLPICVHPGATESIYVNAPSLGYVPTYYLEFHTCLTQPAQSAVASLICSGVFERYPDLKYVFIESGFVWAMDVLWRLERDWKAHREEVPWVTKRPLEYLESNVRFTTQPFYEAEKPEHIRVVLEAIRAEHTLLFSSDYPHWDYDDPQRALADVPKEIRRRVFADNAVETFGDRLL